MTKRFKDDASRNQALRYRRLLNPLDKQERPLHRQWEIVNGREWPRCEKDIVNAAGIVVKKAGTLYDAHHIKPLCLGGKNEAENITPLSMDKHLTTEGIHRKGGACDRMTKLAEERQR